MAIVDKPHLLEVVRTDRAASAARVLDAVIPRAFVPAETAQTSTGGGNSRFGSIFAEPAPDEAAGSETRSCAIVSDRPVLAGLVTAALETRSFTCHEVDAEPGFAGAAKALTSLAEAAGPIDGVVVALSGSTSEAAEASGWHGVLSEHAGLVEDLHVDGGWARATAEYASSAGRAVRLVTLTDAATTGGRSRAQASAQLTRAAAGATGGQVTAFAAAIEAPEEESGGPAAALVAHLLTHHDAPALAGAELVVGAGWIGLRSHPRPVGSIVYGGPALPDWLDTALREAVGEGKS